MNNNENFIVTLSDLAIKLRINKFIGTEISQEKIIVPTKSKTVEWNGYTVIEIKNKPAKKIITKNLGPCVGVLVKGYDQFEQVTHIGLVHLYGDSENIFSKFLDEINSSNCKKLEFFIAGGKKDFQPSETKYKFVISKINKNKIPSSISKDIFGMVLKDVYVQTETSIYSGSIGIQLLGFTDMNQPFAIINTNISGYKEDEKVNSVFTI